MEPKWKKDYEPAVTDDLDRTATLVPAAVAAQQTDLDYHTAKVPVGDDEEQNYGATALADDEDAADALSNMVIAQYCHV